MELYLTLPLTRRIASLYGLWYERREEVIRTYTEELPERIPLVDNTEFKSIKNVVIQEALNISADRVFTDEQDEQAEADAEVSEPTADEVEEQEYAPARDLFSVPACGSYTEAQRNCSTERATPTIRTPL